MKTKKKYYNPQHPQNTHKVSAPALLRNNESLT